MSQMSQAPEMSECLNPRGDSENKNARNDPEDDIEIYRRRRV